MATHKTLSTDYSGGLFSPHLRGRNDIDKYSKAAQRMENFLPLIQGPAHYREGFRHIAGAPAGNVRLIEFTVNDDNRYLLVLSAYQILIYDSLTFLLLYTRGTGLEGSVVPYSDSDIPDVRWTKEVEKMIFTHSDHVPRELDANTVYVATQLLDIVQTPLESNDDFELYSGSVGSGSLTPWDFTPSEFTSHAFKTDDVSGNVLRIDTPIEVVRLTSTNAADFSFTANQLDPLHVDSIHLTVNAVYVEYQAANQYSLGRVLVVTPAEDTGAFAPEDPTGLACYIDPVERVVNMEDPSVRLAMIEGNDTNAPWTIEDRISDGDFHVRADALVFQTSHIGAWIRIGGDRLLTNVARPVADAVYNSQDGLSRWGQIIDYRGVEDHPVDFIEDTLNSNNFEAGITYQVYEWPTSPLTTAILVYDGTGHIRASDLSAISVKLKGTPRFTMTADIYSSSAITITDSTGGGVPPYPQTGLLIANMSTQRQFDVVEVESTTVKVAGTNLLVPVGTVSVFDLVTDPEGLASHTANLTASQNIFEPATDIGRYIHAKLINTWVLLKITSISSPRSCGVDVLSPMSFDQLTGDILNNGVFTSFKMGAWFVGNYPSCVSFYEQRRIYAGTKDSPNFVWLSKTKEPTDFRTIENDGIVLDTSGITYELGTSSTRVRWMVSGPTLVCGTESSEWQLRPNEFSAALTPETVRITQETDIGSETQALRIGSSVFLARLGGKSFLEFKFDFQNQSFASNTVTKLVPTLFGSDPIKSFTFQKFPFSTFWIVTEAGRLISLTYRKEDDFYAWAEHPIEGTVLDVVSVVKGHSDTAEDQVWIAAERNGVRTLEVLAPSFVDDGSDNFKTNLSFLDSHLRAPLMGYAETSTTAIASPARFGGSVATVVDGVYLGILPVVNSMVVLPEGLTVEKYSLIGFQYDGFLQSMPQSIALSVGNTYGKINKTVNLRPYLYQSVGFDVGFKFDGYDNEEVRGEDGSTQPMGESPPLFTGFTREVAPNGSHFDVDAVPIIRQSEPYPLNIVSVLYKVEVNT